MQQSDPALQEPIGGKIVRLRQVCKSYALGATRVTALDQVDLDISEGEFAAVVGASGSGKSTLLNMIGCIDEPDSGLVEIDGVSSVELDEGGRSALRNQKIGFIFQSFNLVPVLSVLENVELPLMINPRIPAGDRRARAAAAIAEVGLSDKVSARPDQLSGGQRQRVAIARALAGHPALVLADEPTANLDSENSRRIVELMLELNRRKGITFLFSTHDERLISKVTRQIHIQDGRIL